MADDHTVNSTADQTLPTSRWWRRRPALGVLAALVSGLVVLWLLRTLGAPSESHAAAFIYMVTLPIALLLPAGAAAGAMLAWSALLASRGLTRVLLALPAAAALLVNVIAIALFVRFVTMIFAR